MQSGIMKSPEAPRASAAAASDIVVVTVGPEKKRYTLHKRLLTHYSGYFRRVLTDGVKCCDFRHAWSRGFDIFVDWMYEKTLPSYTEDYDISLMILTYWTAKKLPVEQFKKALLNKIFDLISDSHLGTWCVCLAFMELPSNGPLLQLIVDTFCMNNGVKNMSDEYFAKIDDLPKEYLARVLRKLHQLSELPEADRGLAREDHSMVVCMPYRVAEEE